jgi:hypothetical protein
VPLENIFRKILAHPLRSLYLSWQKSRGDEIHFAEYRFTRKEVERLLQENGFSPVFSDWDDFVPMDMCLGIWADFPQLHSRTLYRLNAFGRFGAILLNSISRWTAAGGIFCLARKQ